MREVNATAGWQSAKHPKVNTSDSNYTDDFKTVMRAAELNPPDVIEPGKLHRFPRCEKRRGNTAGWCKLFHDGLGGVYGDWSTGLSEIWQAKRDKLFTPAERAAFKRLVGETRAQAETERKAKQTKAASVASAIWKAATSAHCHHPYLIRKGIKAHGAKLYTGALTLPVMDFTDKLTSLQFIKPNGYKLLLRGGRKHGCFIPVAGDFREPRRIIVSEGWATGCTLAEDEHTSLVLSAIDAGNLERVALNARNRWPFAQLVIAGDDDRLVEGNPGATKARAAAIAAGALLALPQWPDQAPENLTDFNDLAVWLAGSGS